jgi:hypothetical protein
LQHIANSFLGVPSMDSETIFFGTPVLLSLWAACQCLPLVDWVVSRLGIQN